MFFTVTKRKQSDARYRHTEKELFDRAEKKYQDSLSSVATRKEWQQERKRRKDCKETRQNTHEMTRNCRVHKQIVKVPSIMKARHSL